MAIVSLPEGISKYPRISPCFMVKSIHVGLESGGIFHVPGPDGAGWLCPQWYHMMKNTWVTWVLYIAQS